MNGLRCITRAGALAVCTWCAALAPSHAADEICAFRATGGFALAFGILDPSNAVTVTVPVGAAAFNSDRAGDCQPKNRTMTISADSGQNASGGTRRMRSAAGDFIAYSLNSLPMTVNRPGNNQYDAISFTGTVLGSAYQDASAGLYTDTVTITVTP